MTTYLTSMVMTDIDSWNEMFLLLYNIAHRCFSLLVDQKPGEDITAADQLLKKVLSTNFWRLHCIVGLDVG